MNKKSSVVDISLGEILHGPVQFISQHVPKKPDADFEIILPGMVTRCGGITGLLAVLPYARIAIHDGKVPHFATVTATVLDESGLNQALGKLADKIGFKSVDNFAIRLGVEHYSFADITETAELSDEGCCEGCGKSGGTTIGGYLSIGAADSRSQNKMVWADPVRTNIKVKGGDDDRYGLYDPGLPHTMAIFDCYSEWWIKGFWQERFTTCHGPCANNKPCNCGQDGRGNRQISCPGWVLCTCF